MLSHISLSFGDTEGDIRKVGGAKRGSHANDDEIVAGFMPVHQVGKANISSRLTQGSLNHEKRNSLLFIVDC
jgi:hypothetical protein